MNIIQRHITKNPAYVNNVNKADSRYTQFQSRGPQGAVLHSIGVAQPSALAIAKNFDSPSYQASVHAVLQADGTVYQLAPWNYRMWHAGGSANNTHVGVEMTEPDCISYDAKNGYRVTVHDKAKALAFVRQTYAVAVELFAGLCKQYGWDPLRDGVIISHAEAFKRGWGSDHGDPEHLWNATGSGYTMDTFRAAVKDYMENGHHREEEVEMTREEVRQLIQTEVKAALAGMMPEVVAAVKATAPEIVRAYRATLQDNDAGNYSAEAREWAIANGIFNGAGNLPDGTPNYMWEDLLTREQAATLLYRFEQRLVPVIEETVKRVLEAA